MESFRCYDNSDVIATLVMTNFHLNTTVVAIFPNVCLWRRSLCSDLLLTLKNRIEPPSYAKTAYVVAIWSSFLFDFFVKIWATSRTPMIFKIMLMTRMLAFIKVYFSLFYICRTTQVNAQKCYWMLIRMQKSLLNLIYAQILAFSR